MRLFLDFSMSVIASGEGFDSIIAISCFHGPFSTQIPFLHSILTDIGNWKSVHNAPFPNIYAVTPSQVTYTLQYMRDSY